MTYYNKFGVGKLMTAKLPNGKIIHRQDRLITKMGGELAFLECVPDDDHFLFQALMPILEQDLIIKYRGVVPVKLRGALIRCTCGSIGITIMQGGLSNNLICQHYATFGRHLTSEKIVNGQLVLSKESSKWLYDGSNFDESLFTKRGFLA